VRRRKMLLRIDDKFQEERMKPKRISVWGKGALCTLLLFLLSACVTAQKEIALKQNSTATGVFKEIQDGAPTPKDVTDLVIKASIKTPVSGYHLFESEKHRHGKPNYPFVFNVDGQAVVWEVDGVPEITSQEGEDKARGPEAGEGFRYLLEKRIHLAPNSHTVFFGLPDEDCRTENMIEIEKNRVNVLEYRPVYGKTGRAISPHFLYGIKGLEVYLNGTRIGRE
jgi:hypothetical protein